MSHLFYSRVPSANNNIHLIEEFIYLPTEQMKDLLECYLVVHNPKGPMFVCIGMWLEVRRHFSKDHDRIGY